MTNTLDFEGTLAALQGWLGQWVAISAGDADEEGPQLVLNLEGTLAAGSGLDPAGAPGETFYFHVAENWGSGFFLNRNHFMGSYLSEEEHLHMRLGGVEVMVMPGSPREE